MQPDDDDATRPIAAGFESASRLALPEACLIVLEGPDRGRTCLVVPPAVRIGSRGDNDIILSDDSVSRRHAIIEHGPAGYRLRDLGSTNGIHLGGARIDQALLAPGVTFRIGDTRLRFELLAPDSSPLPPGDILSVAPSTSAGFGPLMGDSPAMREVCRILEKAARTDLNVLVIGETGTGKELVARALHGMGPRREGPFVVFDASAVSADLVESCLFGHRRGSFTGADSDRAGALRSAHGGTLLIDEMGELPLELQPKLLRALEMRQVTPLGQDTPVDVDVRVIAVTNRDLRAMVIAGSFRQDLYYRLSVIQLRLPPLRERPGDVTVLARHILAGARPEVSLTPEALAALEAHSWPGNVRELKNVLDRALAFAGDGEVTASDLSIDSLAGNVATVSLVATPHPAPPVDLPSTPTPPAPRAPPSEPPADPTVSRGSTLEDQEIQAIREALRRTRWNRTEAARLLGINRKTLRAKIEKYRLEP